MLPELTTLAVAGDITSAEGPVIVNVAATIVPTLSLTVRATEVAGVFGATVTTNVPPLEGTFQMPLPGVPLNAAAGLFEVTV